MAAEEFANFTGGIQDATDSLGDFSDALGDAAESAGEAGDFADLGGEGVGGAGVAGKLGQVAGALAKADEGAAMKAIASTLLNIASAGLPPGVGTVLTKAIGSKL